MSFDVLTGYIVPDLYDAIYSWYGDDVAFYVAAARDAGGPVLEVGCGTGRILIPTLEAGADIEGIDLNPGMLEVLRAKAAARGLTPRVTVGDMRDFTLPRRFSLITIPFRAFLHNLTTEDQLATLVRCREHLAPGGTLVFNSFYPSFDYIVNHTNQVGMTLERELTLDDSGRRIEIWSHHVHDRVNQVLSADKEVRVFDAQGGVAAVHPHRFRLRWFYKAEMELLLRVAGFARWQVRGGFDGRPLERDTDEMVWTAWRD